MTSGRSVPPKVRPRKRVDGHGIERGVLRFPVEIVGGGDGEQGDAGEALGGRDVPELDEAVGLVEGERAEHGGVDDGEDGGVGADAEGEDEDGADGEGGVVAEGAEGLAEVLE